MSLPFSGISSNRTYPCSTVRKVRSVIRSGRGIRRLVSLCGTITQLVMENDRRLLASASDGSDDDNEEEEPPEKKEEVQR